MGSQSRVHCWFQWGPRFYFKIHSLFQFLIDNGGFWYFSMWDVDIFLCHEDIEVDDETGGPWVHSRRNTHPWAGNCKKLRWLNSKCAVRVPHFQISLWMDEVVASRGNVRDFSLYVGQQFESRGECIGVHLHIFICIGTQRQDFSVMTQLWGRKLINITSPIKLPNKI